jgi:hypothetical protein
MNYPASNIFKKNPFQLFDMSEIIRYFAPLFEKSQF